MIPTLPAPGCDDPCNPGPGCPLPPPECGGGSGETLDKKKPAGKITVWDSNLGMEVPVKRTRVVARRWFKIDVVYTNDQGEFKCNKRFVNKVNILVKFLNNNITIHGLRTARLWQMWFPIKKGIGIYSGNLSNISYRFNQNTLEPHSRTNRNWWAAQTMNSQVEFNEMAAANNIGGLPSFMRILLTGWANARGAGSAPMNGHRNPQIVPPLWINYFVLNPAHTGFASTLNWLYNGILIRKTDMTIGYDKNLKSDQVKALIYHEMSHAAHYNKVGDNWWNELVNAETYEITRFGLNGAQSPYGIGDDGEMSGRIALAESWAEHIGRVMTDTKYGTTSSAQYNQGEIYVNNSPVMGLSSHLNLLEDFDPSRTGDPFKWIPQGLYYDIIDNRNDLTVPSPRVLINDQVDGYTNLQFFDALDNDILTLPAYRDRLLQESGNNQGAQVINLFAAYGY